MKKLSVIVVILLAIPFLVLAQSNDSDDAPPPTSEDPIENAYQCLENLIDDKEQSSLSLQEAVFSTLALGADSKLRESIADFEQEDNCYGESSCTIKETAQVLLAQDRINRNTKDIESWLLSKNETATELTWFLQIDITNHEEASCTLTYQDSDKTININDDQTLSGNAGSCLAISSSGFWLRVNDACIDEEFRISCDQDFVTSLLYQRQGSSTIFVSPSANSAAALGTTTETINSKCLRTGSACDYEGSLWAILALDQTGYDVTAYLPYLLALAQENQRFFPAAFLHTVTQGTDQYSEIIQAQQQGQYWQAPNTQYNRFYDTSLAMLSLQGTGAQELTSAQDYLVSIQTPEGCWNNNNIRDTAFVLYSGWSKSVPTGSDGGGGGPPPSCVASGHECVSSLFACTEAGGSVLDEDCDFGVCCSVALTQRTCAEQSGIVCTSTQQCSGTITSSADGSCCLGSCIETPQANACETVGGSCFSSCTATEEQLSESCSDPGLVCCIASSDETDSGSGGNIWPWVIVLIILIILAILAIVFRKRLQLAWFKLRHNKKGAPPRAGPQGPQGRGPPKGRPPFGPPAKGMRRPLPPPAGAQQRMPPTQARASTRPPNKAASKTDKEFEETLKKLKEIGE